MEMNTRHESDQLSAAHYDRKWREIIAQMPQGGDYCFYMRQYGYDIIKAEIDKCGMVFDYACGLGILTHQIQQELECLCYGCDISEVAAKYARELLGSKQSVHVGAHFKGCPILGKKYDYIIATYFIEHIPDPAAWVREALTFGKRVIASIPNNFKRAGEHSLMAWNDWPSFYAIFSEFAVRRIDEGKYHPWLPAAYHHPTFIFSKK